MRKTAATIAFILFIGWMVSLEAGMNKWTKLPDPRGGKSVSFTAVPLSYGTVFFAGTDVNGFFRSTDGGETWLQGCFGKPKTWIDDIAYQITPDEVNILIASWREGVFKSTDLGLTCEEINTGLPSKDATGLATTPDGHWYVTLYGKGVYVSVDKGQNWSKIDKGLPNDNTWRLDSDSQGNVYVSTWGDSGPGVIYQLPAGSSEWVPLSNGAPNANPSRLFAIDEEGVSKIYAGFYKSGLWKLVDGTWVSVSEGLPPKSIVADLMNDEAGNQYLSVFKNGVYTRTKEGGAWSRIDTDPNLPSTATYFFERGDEEEWLFGTWGSGVVKCPQLSGGCKQVFFLNDLTDVYLYNTSWGELWLGTDTGSFKWDEKGKLWIPIGRGSGEVGTNYSNHITEHGSSIFISTWSYLYRSDDRGLTWKETDKRLEKKWQIRIFSCQINGLDILLAAHNEGISKSDDNGETWRPLDIGEKVAIWTIGCLPDPPEEENEEWGMPAIRTGRLLAAQDMSNSKTVLSSTDGETWQEVELLSDARPFDFACNASENACYAGSLNNGFPSKSVDGGKSWSSCANFSEGSVNQRKIAVDGEEIFRVGDYKHILHSTDGCQNWEKLGVALPTSIIWAMALQKEGDDRTLYVGTAGKGIYAYSSQVCGNERKERGETCDDGNQEAGDGCTELCEIEDDDKDGIANLLDNCPQFFCLDQTDSDQDGQGDVCDDDDDGDGLLDSADNCISVVNEDQLDIDGDGSGDLCDDDRDGDEAVDETDNCKLVQNSDQLDTDNDGLGDVCDDDKDGDNYLDLEDNCPLMVNADQLDSDQDKLGDLCDETPQPIVVEEEEEVPVLTDEELVELAKQSLPPPFDPETGLPLPGHSKESSGETAQAGGTSGGDSGGAGGGGGVAGCSLMIDLDNKVPFDYSLWTPVLILIFFWRRAVLVKSHRSACRRNG